MHKKGGKRGGDGGSGHEAPARRRKPPATLLESVHFHAMERADYKPPKNHGGLFHHGPHGVTDEIIKREFSRPPCLLPRTQTRQTPSIQRPPSIQFALFLGTADRPNSICPRVHPGWAG
jgi:hypothetical protein